jgi:molybdenum cofactor biosynthesis protein B
MSHPHQAHAAQKVRAFVLTVSDTRTEATDTGGQLLRQLLQDAGHEIVGATIVRDDPDRVREVMRAVRAAGEAEVLIATGGTGISHRDNTYEAVSGLLDKRLDGFGELFRMLSYQEVGAAAMLSRATGGLLGTLVVFALPGSPKAIRLALERLILPELGHLVAEAKK